MDTNNATATNTSDNASHASKLDGVISMDDFMSGYGADYAAKKAAKSVASTQNKAAGSKPKPITPTPGLGPVAIGARSSKSTIALHEKYQALGIPQPLFTYEGSSDRGWHGTVSFPGLDADELQDIKDDTVHSNKQEVKEGLSEKALAILSRLENEGKVKKMSPDARAKSSKYKVALHDKHQKLGIQQPFFAYTGSTEKGWVAEVTFPGLKGNELPVQSLKNDTPFPNKQEAREALSKHALDLISAAESTGAFDKFAKTRGPSHQAAQEKKDAGPNYVGQLLEFQRATGSPQPTYTDSSVGTLFTCQVTIPPSPTTTYDAPLVFGPLDATHTSKKAARQYAAKCAIEHFKEEGSWPEEVSEFGGIKKKKKIAAASEDPDIIPLTIPPSDLPTTNTATHDAPPLSSSSTSASNPARTARLSTLLSLGTPEWVFTPSPSAPDFYSVACFFTSGGPHAGPIGEVRNVFGKKKAKEECARRAVEYLEEVYRMRVEAGRGLLEGVKGGEELVKGKMGRRVEGESGVGGGDEKKGEEGSDGEEGFEDAVEEMEM
jgi:hypothetical protein